MRQEQVASWIKTKDIGQTILQTCFAINVLPLSCSGVAKRPLASHFQPCPLSVGSLVLGSLSWASETGEGDRGCQTDGWVSLLLDLHWSTTPPTAKRLQRDTRLRVWSSRYRSYCCCCNNSVCSKNQSGLHGSSVPLLPPTALLLLLLLAQLPKPALCLSG